MDLEDSYAEMKGIFEKLDWKDPCVKGYCLLSWSLFLEHWTHSSSNSNSKFLLVQQDLPYIKQSWRDKYGQDSKVFDFLTAFVSSNREWLNKSGELIGNSSSGNNDILVDIAHLNLESYE